MRLTPILMILTLSACAGVMQIGPAGPDPTPTIIGEGTVPDNEIVVYRPAQIGMISNVGTAPAVLLDGRTVGTCRIGQPLVLKVPDGTWTITAITANGKVVQEVTVGKGSRANLRCSTSSVPSLSPAPTLEPVGTEIAMHEAGR